MIFFGDHCDLSREPRLPESFGGREGSWPASNYDVMGMITQISFWIFKIFKWFWYWFWCKYRYFSIFHFNLVTSQPFEHWAEFVRAVFNRKTGEMVGTIHLISEQKASGQRSSEMGAFGSDSIIFPLNFW